MMMMMMMTMTRMTMMMVVVVMMMTMMMMRLLLQGNIVQTPVLARHTRSYPRPLPPHPPRHRHDLHHLPFQQHLPYQPLG